MAAVPGPSASRCGLFVGKQNVLKEVTRAFLTSSCGPHCLNPGITLTGSPATKPTLHGSTGLPLASQSCTRRPTVSMKKHRKRNGLSLGIGSGVGWGSRRLFPRVLFRAHASTTNSSAVWYSFTLPCQRVRTNFHLSVFLLSGIQRGQQSPNLASFLS